MVCYTLVLLEDRLILFLATVWRYELWLYLETQTVHVSESYVGRMLWTSPHVTSSNDRRLSSVIWHHLIIVFLCWLILFSWVHNWLEECIIANIYSPWSEVWPGVLGLTRRWLLGWDWPHILWTNHIRVILIWIWETRYLLQNWWFHVELLMDCDVRCSLLRYF